MLFSRSFLDNSAEELNSFRLLIVTWFMVRRNNFKLWIFKYYHRNRIAQASTIYFRFNQHNHNTSWAWELNVNARLLKILLYLREDVNKDIFRKFLSPNFFKVNFIEQIWDIPWDMMAIFSMPITNYPNILSSFHRILVSFFSPFNWRHFVINYVLILLRNTLSQSFHFWAIYERFIRSSSGQWYIWIIFDICPLSFVGSFSSLSSFHSLNFLSSLWYDLVIFLFRKSMPIFSGIRNNSIYFLPNFHQTCLIRIFKALIFVYESFICVWLLSHRRLYFIMIIYTLSIKLVFLQ